MALSSTLRRASKIQERIEALREQLAGLLDQARTELLSDHADESPGLPSHGALRKRGSKAKRGSLLAGRKRAASPSGPLAPAVVRVLAQKNKPMTVRDILAQLLANGYSFNSPEPKKNLAARIYRLKGVKQVGAGLFAKV